MFRLPGAVGMCGVSLALAAMPARGLDPHTALMQYGYQSWQTDTGLPQNTVHAIVQGRDGFLWIATEGGVVRFDGANFAVMTRANAPELPSDLIDDLMEDRSGPVHSGTPGAGASGTPETLWISTSGGLARMRDGKVEAFAGIPATQVWRTFQQTNGTVWALTAAGLFRIEGERAVRVDADLNENSRMVQGAEGTLWLGTQEGLLRAGREGAFHAVGATGEVTALAVDGGTAWAGMQSGLEACVATGCRSVALPGLPAGRVVNALTIDGTGRLWIATDQGVFSLISLEQKQWNGYPVTENANFLFCDREGAVWAGTPQGLVRFTASDNSEQWRRGGEVYLSAAEDREGDLWLGTESGGLAVLRDRKFSTLTAEDGLTEDYVLALAQAPNGHVAAGTKGGGLNVFHDGQFHALTTAQGLSSNVVLAVAAAANGDVWVGTPDGLDLLRGGQMARVFTTADGLADDFVRSLYVGSHGELWIGTRRGLSRYANGKFDTWTQFDGLGSDLIGAMLEGHAGNLWIGTLGGLTQLRDERFRNFTTRDGLSSDVVTALYEDYEGTLWIGTNDGGLNRMRGGRIAKIASSQLPERVIAILKDNLGYLWISSNSGVYRARRAALEAHGERWGGCGGGAVWGGRRDADQRVLERGTPGGTATG